MRAENDLHVDERRLELGDFLRRRRAELTTDVVGLPPTRRRRTPGLRREEVAELANISAALYAWLEQGRDVPISHRTLEAIAGALQFTTSERDHLYALATRQLIEPEEEISSRLERTIGALRDQPAFVVNHKWDALLINRAAHVIFRHEDDEVLPHLNILETTFGTHGRALFANWRDVASSLVELFRYDYARYAADAETLAVVRNLRSTDADFAQIWDEHRVRRAPKPDSLSRINNAAAGVIDLQCALYDVVESPGLHLMVFTPADDTAAERIDCVVEKNCAELDNPAAGSVIRLR
jgi:transcriptional regulator with XRE-family HTH domain